ncbi:MAG: methyl-accepting chemotaxis protein [Ruminococcus sp.]|nr:methyl-accepting chemotaxis protein [Ruminococcus sp.]
MKFKQKMLTLCCVPLVISTVLLLVIGLIQFQSGMYKETKNSLKSSALAAMNLYNSQGYGNYERKADGNVWRGMNFNVSEETSVVDDLKEQIGVDITFFYQDTAVMTSICNEENLRWIGMQAGENIRQYTLAQGTQLWYRNIEIDGRMNHAYIIPITQPGDGSVIGALMASVSTDEFDAAINQYILYSVLISLALLLIVAVVIFGYIGGFTKVLHDVRRVLLKVSNGDLSDERLKDYKRKDEFGELAVGTERLRSKIGHIFDDIQNGTEKLGQAVEQLNVTSNRTTQAAGELDDHVGQIDETALNQKDKTEQAREDVEITKNAIDLMVQQIYDLNQTSDHMAELSGKSCDILAQLLADSQDSQKTIREINGQVSVTNESVEQIKSVTEYITNIAEETTLLALNASIEAARAGEAGRGFAVVAQEIQKLATESNNSAVQIGENIQSLVEKIQGIVAVMGTVENMLGTQEENVIRTKAIFDELNDNIMFVTQKEADMQKNVSSMNTAKDNMSDIINKLAEFAINNAEISEDAKNATGQMIREMDGLTGLIVDLTELAANLDKNLHAFRQAEE